MGGVPEPALVQTLRAHTGEVTCADACGARLATGGGDRALRVWRWAAGAGWQEAARAAPAHRYGVTAARWAPGGALLGSGGVDGALRVWSSTLASRRALGAPTATAVRALCWAGRARLLAGHDDGSLCVWHVPRGSLLARLQAHEGALHAVSALAANALLLTACTDGVLKVFDLEEVCRSGSEGIHPAALTWEDGAHDMGALCADATEDGALCATGGHDALVRLWRAGERGVRAAGALEGHAAAVTALRWAPGGAGAPALLGSASLDRTARLWAPDTLACVHVLHAHPRYLTCIALDHHLNFMITGSNDKSVKTWSLGALTLDSEIEPPCAVIEHFGLGDLEGIGPVEEEVFQEEASASEELDEGGEMQPIWLQQVHTGAVNCIAVSDNLIATASSDGTVRVFLWAGEAPQPLHALEAHQYPAMACDFGSGGAMLLTAGLDGQACVWDVESGVQLRSLCVPGNGADGGEAGGGGVRGARVSSTRPPMLLLATDDGLAPVWSLASADPRPEHGHSEAVTCCAWSGDGRVAATGAASGELRVLVPPPAPRLLHHESHAHDLGVQSCDFAPTCDEIELPENSYMLATAGSDSFIKLWIIEYKEGDTSAAVRLVQALEAHGGGAASVRWGARGVLGSAGADRWARVWRAAGGVLRAHCAVCAPGAGGALCVALLPAPPVLLLGTMAGELAAWSLPEDSADLDSSDDEAVAPRLWTAQNVAHWLREYVTRAPGSEISPEKESELIRRVELANITGPRLFADPIDELTDLIGFGEDSSESDTDMRVRLTEELEWLRREPPTYDLEAQAPHALLCPLSHRLLREPARAADGYTYERANILDWFIAADGAVSPVTGRRLRNARTQPNYDLRKQLRQFLLQHAEQHTDK